MKVKSPTIQTQRTTASNMSPDISQYPTGNHNGSMGIKIPTLFSLFDPLTRLQSRASLEAHTSYHFNSYHCRRTEHHLFERRLWDVGSGEQNVWDTPLVRWGSMPWCWALVILTAEKRTTVSFALYHISTSSTGSSRGVINVYNAALLNDRPRSFRDQRMQLLSTLLSYPKIRESRWRWKRISSVEIVRGSEVWTVGDDGAPIEYWDEDQTKYTLRMAYREGLK